MTDEQLPGRDPNPPPAGPPADPAYQTAAPQQRDPAPRTELAPATVPGTARAPRGGKLVSAWVGVALIPFFLIGAFVVGYIVTGLLEPSGGEDLSLGAAVLTFLAMLAVFALPCLLAASAGGRAVNAGDAGGRTPRIIGLISLVAFTAWGIVTIGWNWLALGIYS